MISRVSMREQVERKITDDNYNNNMVENIFNVGTQRIHYVFQVDI